MAKPIFLIGISKKSMYREVEGVTQVLEKKFTDYHILVYSTNKVEEGEFLFNALYEKDFDKIKLEELKAIVKDEFDTIKNEIKSKKCS